MHKTLILCLLSLLVSCVALKRAPIKKSIKKSAVFAKGYTGFMLYDPKKDKVVYQQNEGQYFVPASNTKLFTFYASLKILGDSIKTMDYIIRDDSLIFWGNGDPSFLHPDFQNDKALGFLMEQNKSLYFANNFQQVVPLGPGWSWDWYNYYFSTERSAFPVYGNVVRFQKTLEDTLFVVNPYFFYKNVGQDAYLMTDDYRILRAYGSNQFTYNLADTVLEFETDKPFKSSDSLFVTLLEDTLHREIKMIDYDRVRNKPHQVVKGVPADSLYKKMLQNSDNFIAEQLMILCANELRDSLDQELAIEYATEHLLNDLPDEPRWSDGSGLSKYNMFTPRSIVGLLKKISKEYFEERILAMFPAGGESGTIKNWYKAEEPYVFAKTGSLSNSTCLSGYLFTKSGKKLIFSFMHNNYMIRSSRLKKEMEKVLWQIHSNY